jgi:hypothetical protein
LTSTRWELPPQHRRQPGFVEASGGDGDHGVLEHEVVGAVMTTVGQEESRRAGDGGAFVAVEKPLAFRQLERVGRTNVMEVAPTTGKCVLGRREGRLKSAAVTPPIQAAELRARLLVQGRDGFPSEKSRLVHRGLLRELAEQFGMAVEHSGANGLGLGWIDLVDRRRRGGVSPHKRAHLLPLGGGAGF